MSWAELGRSVRVMAVTPTKATTRNSPERKSKGFQRTVIGRFSLGSRRRTARRETPSRAGGHPGAGANQRRAVLEIWGRPRKRAREALRGDGVRETLDRARNGKA